jgi:hypothetical protein
MHGRQPPRQQASAAPVEPVPACGGLLPAGSTIRQTCLQPAPSQLLLPPAVNVGTYYCKIHWSAWGVVCWACMVIHGGWYVVRLYVNGPSYQGPIHINFFKQRTMGCFPPATRHQSHQPPTHSRSPPTERS